MFCKPFMSLRRFSGSTLTVLFLSACLCAGAQAQTAPAAIASFATGLSPIAGLGTIVNIATDSFGDLLVVDATNGALYEFPANGGAPITLVAPSGLAGTVANQLVVPGIAIDASNNL